MKTSYQTFKYTKGIQKLPSGLLIFNFLNEAIELVQNA